MNVLDGDTGRLELRRLGARSVPVVSRGDRFVFAQIIRDVVEFLGLEDETAPELSPAELALRYDQVLDTAIRLVLQMPDDQLENVLPDRPRSWRVLMHHVFLIPSAFLDMQAGGQPFTHESLTEAPPENMRSSDRIAAFGRSVRSRFAGWWSEASDERFDMLVEVYFGNTSRHELLERTVWHTRQIASLLEQGGVAPDRPLTAAQIEGLPLTDRIWDD